MNSKVTLLMRHSSEQLSTMCKEYGTTSHGTCPKGVFVCPFMHQDEKGSWIMNVPCGEIKSSDWDSLLKPVED